MRYDCETMTANLVQEGKEWILFIQCGQEPRWVIWRDPSKPGRVKVEQLVLAAFQGARLMHSYLIGSLPLFTYDHQIGTGGANETTQE